MLKTTPNHWDASSHETNNITWACYVISSGIFTSRGTNMADLHEINTTDNYWNRYELLVSVGNTSPVRRGLWYSFHCFPLPSLTFPSPSSLHLHLIPSSVRVNIVFVLPHVFVSSFRLPPWCHSAFTCVHLRRYPVFPSRVLSSVSECLPVVCFCFLFLMFFFFICFFFYFFALCWSPFLSLLFLLSFWLSFGFLGLLVFVCISALFE